MLKDKKVVVIGGNGGLGKAYVEAFQKEGAQVYIGARNVKRIDKDFNGPRGYIDISCYQSVEEFVDNVKKRPYHPIWKEMKTQIRTTDEVAKALIMALNKKKTVYYMGGGAQSFFAKLNHISSHLSDLILMNIYSSILKKYLGQQEH